MAPITLFASGYGGTIYTLEFTEGAGLKVLHEQAAGKAPTWVELSETDKTGKLLYTGDEFSPVGNASVYKIKDDGSLELFGKKETGKGATGPVHFAVSRDYGRLFIANYSSASMSSLRLEEDGNFRKTDREDERLKFVGAGPKTDRQEAPHPHGVFLDPTGEFLICTDLGADALRVFLTREPLHKADQAHISPGAGPRHLLFAAPLASTPKAPTLCYLVNELSNTIAVFEVIYPASKHDHLKFKAVGKSDISFLPADQVAKGQGDWTGAELALTPDRKHLIISNRAPDDPLPKDDTDMLAIFKLKDNGQIVTTEPPAFKAVGGRGLRHFSFSPAKYGEEEGSYVAVACQKTNEVVMFKRTGAELEEVARVKDIKEPTCVQWG